MSPSTDVTQSGDSAALTSPVADMAEVPPGPELQDFEQFYRQHHRAVANALSVTLGSSELGTEAADEGMARAYSKWATVSEYDNPAGWVYRVGLNWARSRIRRLKQRLPWSEKPVYTIPAVGDPAVAKALSELDLDQRSVVVLRLMLDLSVNETAAVLGIKAGTVKSRLSRALSTLETALEGHQ